MYYCNFIVKFYNYFINQPYFHRFMLPFHALYVYVNNRNYRTARPPRTLRASRRAFRCAMWYSDVFLMFDIINVNSFEHW